MSWTDSERKRVARSLFLFALTYILSVYAPLLWGATGSRDFDIAASDNITFTDTNDHTLASGLTVSAWIYRDRTNAWEPVVQKGSNEFVFGLAGDGTGLRGWVWDLSENAILGREAPDVGSGAWHHIAFTWDGGTTTASIDLYTDGAVVDDTDTIQNVFVGLENTGGGLEIGGTTANLSGPPDCRMAHIELWDRPLSTEEVSQSMRCPGSVVNGLVGYWPLWDSSTQYDLSINSNNGTNGGTAASSDGPPIGGCGGVQ